MEDHDARTAGWAWGARAVGVLQVLGGALEAAGGVGLLLVPEPTFLTKAGGMVLIGHSADSISAGLRSIWYRAVQETVTSQAAAAAATKAGASESVAQKIGMAVDIAAGMGPSAGTQAVRYAAINAAQKATDRVAIAWIKNGFSAFDHNAVGISRAEETIWFHLSGDIHQARGVSFGVRTRALAANRRFLVTQLAVPPQRAARALQASQRLADKGLQTWGLFGPNCATTTLEVAQEGGIAVPAWARAPAALHLGVRHGYAITAVGSATVGTVVGANAGRLAAGTTGSKAPGPVRSHR
jgi:hypothetical protein